MIKTVLSQLRVKHYIKNLLVFLPIFFSLNILNIKMDIKVIYLFCAFCASSSFVYIINDFVDLKEDRLHPEKMKRPLAKGLITSKQAYLLSYLCLAVAAVFAILAGKKVIMFIDAYILLNVLYSLYLKKQPIVDVFCIVIGFLLRIVAGGFVIGVSISSWLILTITVAAFYLGFGKRRNEFLVNGENINTRKVLIEYNKNFLDKAMTTCFSLTIAFYSLWSIDETVVDNLGTTNLFWTVIIVLLGMFRYSLLIESKVDGDPVSVILGDKMLQFIFIVYLISIIFLVYT